MSENPLVAEPESTSLASGTFLGSDLVIGAQAIGSGSWQAMGLAGIATTVDLAATVADPFGALLSAGFGWLEDHINPLKRWLEDLTGSPDEVKAYSETWENIAGRLESEASDLNSRVASELATASGEAIEAYRSHAESMAHTMEALAESAKGVSGGLRGASQIIDVVHGIVRDIIAQICAAIVEWAAELVFSFGLATPLVIEQATTKVAAGVAKVTDKVSAVVESCQKLEKLLQVLSKGLGHLRSALDKIHPGAARGAHERGLGEGPRPHGADHGPATAHGADDAPAAPHGADDAPSTPQGEHPADGPGDKPGDNPADNGNTRDPDASGKHAADPGSVGHRAAEIAKEKAGDLPRGAGEDVVTEETGTGSKAYAEAR